MILTQLLAVAVVLAGALLVSEAVLGALRLAVLRVGNTGWVIGIATLVWATTWADEHTGFTENQIHLAALVAAGFLTCLWFNDRQPLPARSGRPADTARAREHAPVR